MNLAERIRRCIEEEPDGSISFYEYMEMALYEPEMGYYSRQEEKIGKQGDFYTSSSVGDIFGQVFAHAFMEMITALPQDEPCFLVEMGGGTGGFMRDVLNHWETSRVGRPPGQIQTVMIEKSPYHRSRQEQLLNGHKVRWFDDLDHMLSETGRITGVIFSNELLDAFPVYLVEWRNGQWGEIRVTWNKRSGQFEERMERLENPSVLSYLETEQKYLSTLQDGDRLEVNLGAAEWLAKVSGVLAEGYLITVDYGYLREELYAPHHRKGTLMCYRSHQAFDNPLLDPGSFDITTHVNFSRLQEEGELLGFRKVGYFRQSEFLLRAGILSLLSNHQERDPFSPVSRRNRAARQLIMPGGMGDTFKVLIQAKGSGRVPEFLGEQKRSLF